MVLPRGSHQPPKQLSPFISAGGVSAPAQGPGLGAGPGGGPLKKDRAPGPGAGANPGPITRGQGLAVNGRRDKGYPGGEEDLTVMGQGQGPGQGQGLEGSIENINNVNEAVVSGMLH